MREETGMIDFNAHKVWLFVITIVAGVGLPHSAEAQTQDQTKVKGG
jgi:hypothetical protein